jgi:hypothetical protein
MATNYCLVLAIATNLLTDSQTDRQTDSKNKNTKQTRTGQGILCYMTDRPVVQEREHEQQAPLGASFLRERSASGLHCRPFVKEVLKEKKKDARKPNI